MKIPPCQKSPLPQLTPTCPVRAGSAHFPKRDSLQSAAPSVLMGIFREVGIFFFRLLTLAFNLRGPKIPTFSIADMTPERFATCRRLIVSAEGRQWTTGNPLWRPGPSQRQKASLVHQALSFFEHLKASSSLKNAETHGKITLTIKGHTKQTTLLVKPNARQQGLVEELLKALSEPKYMKDEDTSVTLTFESTCSVDEGRGPVHFRRCESVVETTCHKDLKEVTVIPKKARSKGQYYFSNRSLRSAHVQLSRK